MSIHTLISTFTSAEWTFGPGCFCYSASVLEPRHIGVRPKVVVSRSSTTAVGRTPLWYHPHYHPLPDLESGNGGGGNGAAVNQRLQRTAAAATQRRQRPSGEEMEVQRTSGGSDPAAATTQRRQRTSEPDGGGVGCREREERNGDCGGEGEKEKRAG
ncbi:hypothetical protein DEO72_LG5g3015 [Vigna unguiculata]|uniref:Uncharacterized protein n=1 Tax=Vigna unguiculata TaxID=3917 RepID=A0A4D6M1F1_VIGUN|nr:hypothetical protein DEO72_LG5g3015 [Vigna unguiculata]